MENKSTDLHIGEKFGRWTILEMSSERSPEGRIKVKCVCDCGTIKDVILKNILRGGSRSCGCLVADTTSITFSKDYAGIRVGKLTVIKPTGGYIGNSREWECKCDCGELRYLSTRDIVTKHAKMCTKCSKFESRNRYTVDISGNRYGSLVVMSRDYSIKRDNRAYWICVCDCGATVSIQGKDLRAGKIESCGCVKSRGENKISEYLDNLGLQHIRQHTFDDCRDVRPLRFDFYVPALNMCIEYDGAHHFYPVDYAGFGEDWAEEEHVRTKLHDSIKDEYCSNNGIKMVRVNNGNVSSLNELLVS